MASSTMVVASSQAHSFGLDRPTSCPQCGHSVAGTLAADPTDPQRRMQDLEAQVRLLNSKAAAAVDKLADYEDEVRFLRAAYSRAQPNKVTSPPRDTTHTPPLPASPPQLHLQQQQQSRLSSLSALLQGRRRDPLLGSSGSQPGIFTPTPTTTNPTSTSYFPFSVASSPNSNTNQSTTPQLQQPAPITSLSNTTALSNLQSSLDTERTLRLRAESSLSQTQVELEELTAQLFGQANEMVAAERKARAKLEERVRILETRDGEKRRRLDRLEKALERIERVRGLVS